MAGLAPLAPGEVRVVLAGAPAAGELEMVARKVEGHLSADERARATRFRRREDAWCHVAGRGLLRRLAGGLLGLDPVDVRLVTGEHGKPYLPDQPGLHVNLAHSGGLVAVAVTHLGPVGVDVEEVVPDRATLDIAARFFAPEEEAALAALEAGAQVGAFFETWTRKEAFLKATGLGISRGLASFAVGVGGPASLGRVDGGPPAPRWWLVDLPVPDRWRGALAVEREAGTEVPPHLQVLPWHPD